jgi:hypothetical protein
MLTELPLAGKAARARELKKNKEKRQETREVTLVKKDTRGLEKEIRALQAKSGPSSSELEEINRLQSELKRIKDAKEEYLAKNPEHRKFVYPRESEERAEQAEREKAAQNSLKRQQPQRDPRRSIYYHAIFNPHGAAPPGMPYMEKTAEQWEAEQKKDFDSMMGEEDSDEGEGSVDLDDKSDGGSDDIELPEGPPPLPPTEGHASVQKVDEEDTSEDEDGIVMPKGPPPGPPTAPRAMLEGLPIGPSAMQARPPMPVSRQRPPPLPRPPFPAGQAVYRPPLPNVVQQPPMPVTSWSAPPRPNPPPATPARPLPAPTPSPPQTVITSAPVLRDLKKEATAFVPPALRKKQAALKAKAAKGGLPSAVNAAPRSPEDEERG